VLSVPLPAGTTLVSATDGGTQVGAAVQWELGSLAAGATGAPRTFLTDQIEGTSLHAIEPLALDQCSSLLPGHYRTPPFPAKGVLWMHLAAAANPENERLLEGGTDYLVEADQLALGTVYFEP